MTTDLIEFVEFANGCCGTINITKLKNNDIIKNSKIFNLLFGFKQNNNFKNYNLERCKKSNRLLILKNLSISNEEWFLFEFFIYNKTIPHYHKNIFSKKINFILLNNLETLNFVCHKLGGIPFFDEFYTNFDKNIVNNIKESYDLNFIDCPEKDIFNKYNWLAFIGGNGKNEYSYNEFIKTLSINCGWSYTKQINNISYFKQDK